MIDRIPGNVRTQCETGKRTDRNEVLEKSGMSIRRKYNDEADRRHYPVRI